MTAVLVARCMTCAATVVSTILWSSIVFAAKDNEDYTLMHQKNSVKNVLPADDDEQIGLGLPPR